MEIFCRNIPEPIQNSHLKREFSPVLERFGIFTFGCRKVGKKNAIITIRDARLAQKLLDKHGQDEERKKKPVIQLKMFNQPIYLQKSRSKVDEYALRALKHEEEERERARNNTSAPRPPMSDAGSTGSSIGPPTNKISSFNITAMSCGIWDYQYAGIPVFVEFFRCTGFGKVLFGKSSFRVTMPNVAPSTDYYLELAYIDVRSVHNSISQQPTITITTDIAPRFFISDLVEKLKSQLATAIKGPKPPSKRRVGDFGGSHSGTSGKCFTYRFELLDRRDTIVIRHLKAKHIPPIGTWDDCRMMYRETFQTLNAYFENYLEHHDISFALKFQIAKLVWNGEISPTKVLQLCPYIDTLVDKHGLEVVVDALQRFTSDIEYPGPDTHPSDIDLKALKEVLYQAVEKAEFRGGLRAIHSNNVQVHRAKVTPSGTYLYGPNVESKNRVLRRYSDYIDFFLRVEFVDESGDPIYFDPRASLEHIFQERFKGVLKNGIFIGGRSFSFLGFSHSSLRNQTCWFVAPFQTIDGEPFDAQSIIKGLGDFDHIYSPSKQAARIGQTFSETQTSIAVPEHAVHFRIPDVTRNNRVFSDGVGTISASIMYKIWKEYAIREKVKPTVFQIRFAGAKGMVSLDTRLKGDQIKLRDSMIKFPAKKALDIEVCGSGIRALPFFLNSQIIKILEDLGVPPKGFLELQADEIARLRSARDSTVKAGQFLQETNIANKNVRLPWLMQVVKGLGFEYKQDPFLRSVVQIAIFLKMRDLKYRARIRVPQAVTLYGIMDETGILQEGQIFCTYLSEDGIREILVRDNIVITRAPALHPGDVQYVNAVDVPDSSPLRKLHNCVVFSQFGERDLPSMLSGGDLDGDLYNVIYDGRLLPARTYRPADYPRVEERLLDRKVERDDIIDFFVTFMQQDQLGRIATIHQALADQKENGTLDEKCLLLAELHSTAVDFSKSGIPANLQRIPERPKYYPDFMAPSPRVHVIGGLEVVEDEEYIIEGDEEDERPQRQYYKSEHILGVLYRNIDEQEFLDEIRRASHLKRGSKQVLQGIWKYVESETAGFLWNHYIDLGKKAKEIYEDHLRSIMRQYSKTPWKNSITEIEVFVGAILGQNSKQSRRDKEASQAMREEYQELVSFTIKMILERDSDKNDSLERSIACFWVSLNDHSSTSRGRKQEELLSFRWLAAMVCLQEVDRYQSQMPF